MRLVACLASALLTGLFTLASPPATSSPRFVTSFELDLLPDWQSEAQMADSGSWVKHSSPVVADLGGGPAVLVADQGGKVYALRYGGGSLTKLWDSGAAIQTFIDSSPAVADLDGDGCPEVVVGAGNEFRPHHSGVHVFDCRGGGHRFWPASTGPRPNHVGVFSTPAIGDVTGDGRLEVVYGSFNEKIYVKDAAGNDLPGWPRENLDTVFSSPGLADLTGDGKREIVIGTDLGGGAAAFGCAKGTRGTLSVWSGAGHPLDGFPKCIDTPVWSSPAIADLDGDGSLDIVVGTNNYSEGGPVGQPWKVRAWRSAGGNLLWETPLRTGARVFSSPAVGDVGGNGSGDVAVATIGPGNLGEVYLLDARTGAVRWQRQSKCGEVGVCAFMGSPVIADVDGDGRPDVLVASQNGGLYAWNSTGDPVIDDLHAPPRPDGPEWQDESYMFFNSPAVADLDGDGRNEIVMAGAITASSPLRGKVWVISTPGRGDGPWPMFKRTAARTSVLGATGYLVPPPPPPEPVAAEAAPVVRSAPAPAPARDPATPASDPAPSAAAAPAAISYAPPEEGGRTGWRWLAIGLAIAGAAGAAATGAVFGRRR